jgi:hypothetical protein
MRITPGTVRVQEADKSNIFFWTCLKFKMYFLGGPTKQNVTYLFTKKKKKNKTCEIFLRTPAHVIHAIKFVNNHTLF